MKRCPRCGDVGHDADIRCGCGHRFAAAADGGLSSPTRGAAPRDTPAQADGARVARNPLHLLAFIAACVACGAVLSVALPFAPLFRPHNYQTNFRTLLESLGLPDEIAYRFDISNPSLLGVTVLLVIVVRVLLQIRNRATVE